MAPRSVRTSRCAWEVFRGPKASAGDVSGRVLLFQSDKESGDVQKSGAVDSAVMSVYTEGERCVPRSEEGVVV